MASRRKSRERALQVLFQSDLRHQAVEEAITAFYDSLHSEEDDPQGRMESDRFMEELAAGAFAQRETIDRLIGEVSEHWRVERMPAVDRNILRLAVYEMRTGKTPPAVVIDEALELARKFAGDESVAFVNGCLDAVRKRGAAE
ncbi:MAG TPA: transcription antitermination factor NusB [Solibacterales bacterium]|nr:transcription antitermination factor NusB [Bryobacterales bacterium]